MSRLVRRLSSQRSANALTGSPARRLFLKVGATAVGASTVPSWLGATTGPAVIGSDSTRPVITHGIQFGDP